MEEHVLGVINIYIVSTLVNLCNACFNSYSSVTNMLPLLNFEDIFAEDPFWQYNLLLSVIFNRLYNMNSTSHFVWANSKSENESKVRALTYCIYKAEVDGFAKRICPVTM